MSTKPHERLSTFAGVAIGGGILTGLGGLGVALLGLVTGNWMATGVCLGAAGLAFGLIANALCRD